MAEDIKIRKAEGTWVARAGGAVIADSENALELTESGHDPVIYFPRNDVAMALLEESVKTTTCPHKGVAKYFSIQTKSLLISNAAWSYEKPKPGVEAIARYLAFYPDKVAIEQV